MPRRLPSLLSLLLSVLAAAILSQPRISRAADQFEAFRFARNAYDSGDYVEAAKRFKGLIYTDPPVLTNRALVLDAHLYLGVSLLFTGDREGGEKEFEILLTLSPDYKLDPVLFPVEVVDVYGSVQSRMQEKLKKMVEDRRKAETLRKQAEERRAEEDRRKLEKYYRLDVERSSPLVAVLPFGIGQFQNRHTTKAYILLISEVVLIAGATVTYILHEDLRGVKVESLTDAERDDYELADKVYRYTNWSCMAATGGLLLYGLVDALVYYQPRYERLQRVPAESIPERLKSSPAGLSFTPLIGPTGGGVLVKF